MRSVHKGLISRTSQPCSTFQPHLTKLQAKAWPSAMGSNKLMDLRIKATTICYRCSRTWSSITSSAWGLFRRHKASLRQINCQVWSRSTRLNNLQAQPTPQWLVSTSSSSSTTREQASRFSQSRRHYRMSISSRPIPVLSSLELLTDTPNIRSKLWPSRTRRNLEARSQLLKKWPWWPKITNLSKITTLQPTLI